MLQAGQEVEVKVSFYNPLTDRKLTGCELQFKGGVLPSGGEFVDRDHMRVLHIGWVSLNDIHSDVYKSLVSFRVKCLKTTQLRFIL